jgi:hypothetical protein
MTNRGMLMYFKDAKDFFTSNNNAPFVIYGASYVGKICYDYMIGGGGGYFWLYL